MTTFLSQGIDYLGFLEAKLRDLQGEATLAYELIQNADDAKASRIVFDVRDEALVVENTSLFSDCAQVEADECHWKALYGYRCDFHRFRKVAGGDKRDQEETTGAFGIGFISVYQITDRPELQSGRRHWIIRPDEPEQQRIEVVPVSEHFEGTRFVLPWAIDPNTRLRQRLRTPTLSIPEAADAFTAALACNLPDAILFLKHVECIELRRRGELVKQIQRSSDGDQVVVQDGDSLHLWYILRGSFDTEAQRLRGQYPHQIEQKRTAFVTVAIPEDISKRRGRFCACLPTEQYTELPVYINADFYPSTDRKRILLTNDYQGQWNRAAITEAAKLIASAVPSLTQKFDHNSLWEFFNQIKKVADEAAAGHQDHVFRSFWQFTQSSIENYPTVFIWPAGWKKPTEALLPEQSAKEDALNLWQADKQPLASSTEATLPEQSAKEDALNLWQAMGLSIVHPDLRPYFPLLRAVKVRVLSLADLVQALKQAGLDKTVALEQAPVWIRSRDARDALGCEIQRLSSQQVKSELLADA
ncbi:hypothetical protein, partial [Chloroflexus sp.]|uniref:hypothetical protein n=1 Tax=Chloroflexus sp. TaxID=1904827 RepID=UPI002ACD471B